MFTLFTSILAAISLVAFMRPKLMLLGCILIGFLQDPMRKLLPGEPTYMIVLVGVVFAAGAIGFLVQKGVKTLTEIQMWTPRFKVPIMLFFMLIVFYSVYSYLAYNNVIIVGIGVMSYIAPLLAISISYFAITDSSGFRFTLSIYCLFALLLAASVYLSFNGNGHQILKEVGVGLLIYDQGTILKAHAGYMRSSEIAGWHMGAAASFMLIMAFSSEKRSTWFMAIVSIVILLIAIGMTGRRKMILQFFMFVCLYAGFYMYFRRNISVKVMLAACAVLGVIWVASQYVFPSLGGKELNMYYQRGISVFGDAGDRFRGLGIGSVKWAYDRFGLLGGGVGIAAQGTGAQGINIAGGAGEGGIGRIVAELGLPGILLVIWLVYETVRFFGKALSFAALDDGEDARFAIGIAAFIAANIPTYIVASQVYGDLNILIFLGFLVGFVFALPKIIYIQNEKSKEQNQWNTFN